MSNVKRRQIAAFLAFTGPVFWLLPGNHLPVLLGAFIPVVGLHKFYLKQPFWGLFYILLSPTPIPFAASFFEGVWYLAQDREDFDENFSGAIEFGYPAEPPQEAAVDPGRVGAIAESLRQLDRLRQDGLMSEYEFEQKRRKLLDRIT